VGLIILFAQVHKYGHCLVVGDVPRSAEMRCVRYSIVRQGSRSKSGVSRETGTERQQDDVTKNETKGPVRSRNKE
jgi:hypothetical protein